MANSKYEVVDFVHGGFFVHGGSIGETYFKEKADADLVCDALNMVERLKMNRVMRRINDAMASLEDLEKALKED